MIGTGNPTNDTASTSAASATVARTSSGGTDRDRRAKATTNVARYSASGTTHSSGTAATSVEMCDVTASSSAEGRNARPNQVSCVARAGAVGVVWAWVAVATGLAAPAGTDATDRDDRATTTPHAPTSATNTTNPADHKIRCWSTVRVRSMTSG